MKKSEVIKAIKDRTLYEYICNNGWNSSKEDLIILAKELYYTATCSATKLTHDDFHEELLENIEEYMSDDEEL